MGESLEAWLENHARCEDVHSHQGLQTAKLVTTFAAAIAATFVATSLAEGPEPSCWDEGAVAAMALSVLGVLAVVFRTRKAPDINTIRDHPSVDDGSDGPTIAAMREKVKSAAAHNKAMVDEVRWIVFAQVFASTVASALAIVSVHLSYSS
ncbi:MAG: hypothetical protein QOK02_2153 [Mycobacterium sp.]|jgi:hypothetical protein|nr:hypothetical protein [Mycobacterium sp.]